MLSEDDKGAWDPISPVVVLFCSFSSSRIITVCAGVDIVIAVYNQSSAAFLSSAAWFVEVTPVGMHVEESPDGTLDTRCCGPGQCERLSALTSLQKDSTGVSESSVRGPAGAVNLPVR